MRVGSKSLNRVVWAPAAVATASGLALGLSEDGWLAGLGYTLGSTLVLAAILSVMLLTGPSPRERVSGSPAIGTLAGLLFMLAGLVWMVPSQFAANEELQFRNAAILLMTGGALLTIFQAGAPGSGRQTAAFQNWLAATLISAALSLSLVFAYSQDIGAEFYQESLAWGLAGMFVMLGLPLILTTTLRITFREHISVWPPLAYSAISGTCLAGVAFIVQGISFLHAPADETLWWLPVLAIGVLLTTAAHRSDSESGPEVTAGQQPLRGPILAMLTIIGCISAAGMAVLLRNDPAGLDWALIVVLGWVLAVSALTVCVSALRFQFHLSELGRRVSILARLSRTDALTGVANRRGLDERLASEIQRTARFGHPLSIALIDIDDFKRVNDTYGHAAGDQVLQRLATLLVRELRTIDVIGRYGGEEFLIILPETDVSGAATAAARLISVVRTDEHHYLGRGWRISVSIGIAAFQRNGRTPAELLEAADTALYQAKHQGKNRMVIAGASS